MGDPAAAGFFQAMTLPRVAFAGLSRMPGDARYREHVLTDWEVDLVTSGRVDCVLNGQRGEMAAGCAYAFRPGDRFSAVGAAAAGEYTCRWVSFSWDAMSAKASARAAALPRRTELAPSALAAFQAAFDALLDERAAGDPGWELRASAHLVRLLSLLVADGRTTAGPRIDRRLALGLAFMEKRFASRILIADVARAARMSEDYFSRLFRRTLGMAPMQHLIRLRLREGRRLLLADPSLGVREAARRAGFDDAGHFSKLFRRHFATTPAALRRSGMWAPGNVNPEIKDN